MNLALADPAAVETRLADIENELALAQNELDSAAMSYFRAKREREHAKATAFIQAEGTAGERSARAELAALELVVEGQPVWELEGRWEAMRSKVRILGDRASIGQSLLRAQGRSI